jgi:hypothetical protein
MNRVEYHTQNGAFPFLGSGPAKSQCFMLSVPYKGMILSQEVKALRMGQDSGIFQLPNHQICAGIKDLVYLHGSTLARPIVARITELNTQRGWITLSEFQSAYNAWKDRVCERVQPENPVQVTLSCAAQRCRGTLDDLSLQGMGLLIYAPPEKDFQLKRMENLRLEFYLPGDPQVFRLEGSMVFLTQISHTLAKMGLTIRPNRSQRARMATYISVRSIELAQELEMIWMKGQEPRPSMDLYF